MKRFILQAITEENHFTAVRELLGVQNPQRVILSTAFMTQAGLTVIEDALREVANKTTIFAGIRNGITTAQGLQKVLDIGCKAFVVDTGSRTRIFHPKVFLSAGDTEAHLIVGSANLTLGGMNGNIEASIWQRLTLDDPDNYALIEDVAAKLDIMAAEYPNHAYEIVDTAQIDNLLSTGRVVDESIRRPPSVSGSSRNRDLDMTPNMELKTRPINVPRAAPRTAQVLIPSAAEAPESERLELIWEIGPLVRRDLSIPENENSNPTGSMLFKRGHNDIDQQTFFRTHVFNALAWAPDDRTPGKELAQANFRIVIRAVDYGVYRLTVTHDARTDTASYQQRQPMTAIRWGEARPLLSQEDLIGRTMSLYRDPALGDSFVLEID